MKAVGGTALVLETDVSNADSVEEAAQKIEEHFGNIDIWINNAMVSVFGPLRDLKAKDFRRVTDVTYHGQRHGTMAALKRMLPRDKGTVILIDLH